MLLFDHETQQTTEVPDTQLGEALKSRRYTTQVGAKLNLVNPNTGQVQSFDGADVLGVLDEGWGVETSQARDERKTREKYGEGIGAEAAAAGLGALRGASLGLSDVAISEIGGPDANKALRRYREFNPTATLGGEIAGAVMPALLGGVGGAVGTAARFTPAGSIARLGLATERGVATALAGRGAGAAGAILRGMVPLAAGSAVEGALYGGGEAVTEAVLGDPEMTAEQFLTHVGVGALLGGGAGGTLGLGGLAAKGAIRAAGAGARGTGRAIESIYERATGNKAAPGLGKMWSKVSGVASGADDETLEAFFAGGRKGKELRQKAVQAETVLDDHAQDLREAYDRFLLHSRRVQGEAIGANKLKNIERVIIRGNEDLVSASALYQIDDVARQLDEMLEEGAGAWATTGLKTMRKSIDAYKGRIFGMIKGKTPDNAEINFMLDNLKRDIGARRVRLKRGGSEYKTKETRKRFDDMYEGLRRHLENEELYGEAAKIQADVNYGWVQYLSNNNYRNNFAVKMGSEGFEDVWKANDQKFRTFVRDLEHVETNDHIYLKSQMETGEDLLGKIDDNYNLSPERMDDVIKARKAASDVLKTLDSAEVDVIAINQLRTIEKMAASSGFSAATGAVGGGLVGGLGGAIVGGGVGALLRPGQTIRQLATLERITGGVTPKIKAATSSFIKNAARRAQGAARVTGKAARRSAAPISVNSVSFGEPKRRRAERSVATAYLERLDELAEMVATPEAAGQRLTDALLPIEDVAPNLAAAIAGKTARAMRFLYERAPRPPPSVTDSLVPRYWRPAAPDIARWERYLQAVEDPMSSLDHLRSGTLSREEVETLREVYPWIYGAISENLHESLAELRTELPHRERLQLSTFFGVPVDETMTPDFLRLAQATHVSEQTPQGVGLARPAPPRKVESKMPEQYQTSAQRLEARG